MEMESAEDSASPGSGRRPRLFVKEMVMRNFKSYAGEQRVGPFHKGEVEQISLMKPKAQGPHDEGFLEYLEDRIGTNKDVEKIDESYMELESLNEKQSSVVQMVKLAEKEGDSLEDVKNEAEAYMLKELSLLKWQEKAIKLAYENNSVKMVELQEKVSILEENMKNEG